MIRIQQRISGPGGGDESIRGDCFKTCVASILELPYEQVPHFVAHEWLYRPMHMDSCVLVPGGAKDAGHEETPYHCDEHCDVAKNKQPYKSDCTSSLRNWLAWHKQPLGVAACSYLRPFKELEGLWDRINGAPGTPYAGAAEPLLQYVREPSPRANHGRSPTWIATVVSENFPDNSHAVVMRYQDVVWDPSLSPRRTPYEFIGETWFTVEDPAKCLARGQWSITRLVDGWDTER